MPSLTDTPEGRVVRLIFEHTGDDLRLVSQAPVAVDVAGLDTSVAARPGRYLEVQDAAGSSLGRIGLGADLDAVLEVVPELPGDRITAVPQVASAAFTVLVQVPPTAVDVVAVRVTAGAAPPSNVQGLLAAAPAAPDVTELARFPLDTND